ncbi:MAG: DNA-binding protein [Planctomycetota bacterium]|nr:MAG: DNA-binding protein [Planctomycetota bacterium]RLC76943.1 MAG: DNA-binding protein [Chloroflexota bacterium]
MNKDRLLDVHQVSERLSVAPSTVYGLINAGRIASLRVGIKNCIRIRESEVFRFIESAAHSGDASPEVDECD